ncbi:FAD-dependent oxidoreductase [Streptomyces sodiiphilus]|uniref:FAD-dependent oxidoreductase n=1 Tax=Streptomyces sodiiphilus TaxID=226217 RepID=A0ABN2PNJ1_9ACTN
MVIVGGGMAGARLAQQLGARQGGPEVTVLGEEPHAAYNRVLLAEVLAGQYPPHVIALPAPPDGTVRWRGGVRVVRIDRAERRVVCDDGALVPYDALVLATGSNPVLPPFHGLFAEDGHELPRGVHAFRTMDDCLALTAAAGPGCRAVVIGGGLLGVSAARALARRGAGVVLAQQGERLMERQLDASAAALLRGHLEDLGVEVHTECRVRGLTTEPAPGSGERRVRAVELSAGFPRTGAGGGIRLDADLVVLACGVRPRTGLARAAGLEVARGIVVDDRLATGDPRIFALGDCAEHAGVVYGLAGAAQEQADVLARVLDGGPAGRDPAAPGPGPRYTGTRAVTRLTLGVPAAAGAAGPASPLDLAAFGETVPRPGDDVVELADATRGAYRKIVVRGDRLRGGILLGDLGGVGTLARTWEDDETLPGSPLLHLLTHDGGT